MDKASIFTFKQRIEELTKALRRHASEARQRELDRLKEILTNSEQKE